MPEVSENDDYLHEPTDRPDYRESYYFNWVDLNQGISGFTTIGLLPNIKRREFVFAFFHDNRKEVYWKEPEGTVSAEPEDALSDGVLSYKMGKPLDEWRVSYNAESIAVDLLWKARFPAYGFGQGSGTSWASHFEQSGIVTGFIRMDDQEIRINGLGQRDKSWGSRNWHISQWYALHAQFDEMSIGLRRDKANDTYVSSGGITTDEGHVQIVKVELETRFSDDRMPYAAITKVHGEDGTCYTLESKILSDSSFVRFQREFHGGITELWEEMAIHKCIETRETGSGLLEWLFTY